MNLLTVLFVLFLVLPIVNRLLLIFPFLGILIYGMMIWGYASWIKQKRMRYQRAYQSQSYQQEGKQPQKKDVIDVEFSESEL